MICLKDGQVGQEKYCAEEIKMDRHITGLHTLDRLPVLRTVSKPVYDGLELCRKVFM